MSQENILETLPEATTYLAYVPVFVDIVVYTRSLSWNSVTWRPFWTIIPAKGLQIDAESRISKHHSETLAEQSEPGTYDLLSSLSFEK